jgi:hypothetical protein
MAGIADDYEPASLAHALIVRCEPVGKIELRPMLVPVEVAA